MEKETTPPPQQEKAKPFKLDIKKKEKKELPPEPDTQQEPEEVFKLPQKKKSSVTRKITPKEEPEEPAFSGFKLKKSSQVKRTWNDDKLETVELKHHEFEHLPLEEEAEKQTTVVLSEPIEKLKKDLPEKEKKKKKKKKASTTSVASKIFTSLSY